MGRYYPDIFYRGFNEFSPAQMEEICRDAFSKCTNWWVDDQPGWTRRKIEMPFDEVLKYLYTHKIHFVIIHRRGYEEWNVEGSFDKWHLQIGFGTLNRNNPNGDIFLWIELDESNIPHFINRYKLKEI